MPGASPGLMVVDKSAPRTVLRRIVYGPEHFDDTVLVDAAHLDDNRPPGCRLWIDVQGLGDERALRCVAERFGIHPLAMEDVVSGHQRPKLEEYGELLFLVTRLPVPDSVHSEQVAFVLGADHVISFREQPSALFEPVVLRLRQTSGRLQQRGSDYLLYALLDVATDAQFPLLDGFEQRLDELEVQALSGSDPSLFEALHGLRQRIAAVRRDAVPLRDVVASLVRGLDDVISEQTRVYLRDCHDHAAQVVEALEASRDRSTALMDLALLVSSDRLNNVMKVLTVVTSIFIPLTFIAGLYGMNFDPNASAWNMPELRSPYGYPMVLAVMGLLALVLVLAFRRMGWLGSAGRRRPAAADEPGA